MPRPQKPRRVTRPPAFTIFKPVGVGRRFLEQVTLTIDEYEALRLADYEDLSHEEAAKKMDISRPTFTRLLESARKKVVQMLVEGRQLVIEGGNVTFRYKFVRCKKCGFVFKIDYESQVERCIRCGSTDIEVLLHPIDLGGFGHKHRRRFRGGRH